MSHSTGGPYDMEERTLQFAAEVREFCKNLPKTSSNFEDSKQLIRASGSVGANYIEANESTSKKDFIYRVKISKKEAKEGRYWLKLLDIIEDENLENQRKSLIQESTEIMNIFGSMISKK